MDMEKDEKETLDFGNLISTHKSRLRIYESEISSKPSRFSANEILDKVASDVAVMREADVITPREIRNKKSSSIPLTSFMNYPEKRCEMQTFTDTEMLDAADGAEAVIQMMNNKGMTQLFDTSFNKKDNVLKEMTDVAATNKTAVTVASEVFDVATFNTQDMETSDNAKIVESEIDKVVATKYISNIDMIQDYKPDTRINYIEPELKEEMAMGRIECNRISREKNDSNLNFDTDAIEKEIVKTNLVECDTDNNCNKDEYMNLNLSIEEILGFKEGKILEHRPPSPVLTPTIKFMKSGRVQNVKRKIYSLEAFEQVEASVNKKFRSQAYFCNDEELCSSPECFNKSSNCYILNDNIENDVVLSSDEECFLSQAISINEKKDNSFESVHSLIIDKCRSKSQSLKMLEILENANENQAIPLDPTESEKLTDQALINEEGIEKFHEHMENAKHKTQNIIGEKQSQRIKLQNETIQTFENTSYEFDLDFDEKDKLTSKIKPGSNVVGNICTKLSPEKTNRITDYDTIEAMKLFLGFAQSNKNVGVVNKTQTNIQETLNKTLTEESDALKFKAFTKASNTTKVSEESLAKTKNLLQDIEDIHMRNYSRLISNEALENIKNVFQDIEDINMEEDFDENKEFNASPPTFKGFTASNNNIKVSDKALDKIETIFQDIEGVHDEDVFEESKEFEAKQPTFQGFTTASNKTIKVSDEALAKAKNLFQDIEVIHMNNYMEHNNEFQAPLPSTFQGFSTASNINIKVSDTALTKTKTIFQDIEGVHMADDFDGSKEFISKQQTFQGFTTASNKIIKVSDEALARTKTIFQDIEGVHMEDDFDGSKKFIAKQPTFQGFTTASNKNIKVSDAALTKTKTIFQDIEGVHMEDDFDGSKELIAKQPKFQGFTTASNKNIKVSDEALAKTKTIFQDIEGVHMEDDFDGSKELIAKQPKFQGFTTASNKNIKVSDEAQAKTKTIFQDIEGTLMVSNSKEVKVTEFQPPTKFEGFSTASSKTIKVSEEALAYTKNIFQDFENLSNITTSNLEDFNSANVKNMEMFNEVLPIRKKRTFEGFSNGNNKKTKVSEKALEETKNVFKDLKTTEECKFIDEENTVFNVNNDLLNTQIKSHFEETLYTEDFCETPKKVTPVKNTKSGSPVLPYSTAKRRVFKTPYNINHKIEDVETEKVQKIKAKPTFEYKYDDKYKSNQKIRLNDLKISENGNLHYFDINDMSKFRFSRNDLTDSELTLDALKNIFLNSVDRTLVPHGWLDNHIKLILWKLLSYESKFLDLCGVASPKILLQQLKYRYDRELYKVERPVLRKILERDETAGRCMVLCVVQVLDVGVDNESATNTTELEVTDGWYCVRATIDRALSKAVADGKISSGTKIITHGAELMNCEQGVAPWEDTSSIRLKLSANSTRRVPWYTRLGLHPAAAVRVHLRTLTPEGGKVSAVRAYVARVYPLLFVERFEDGSTVTRSERLETLQAARHESERHARLEAVYQELEREMATSESQEMSSAVRMIKYGEQEEITASQLDRINEESSRKREQILEDIRKRLQEKIEKMGLDKVQRNVVPLLKIRICNWHDSKGPDGKVSTKVFTKACMSVWKPSESLLDVIKEGVWIDAMNVVPTAIRMSELHISAGRQSVFQKLRNQNGENSEYVDSVTRKCTRLAEVRKITEAPFNEVDLAGLVFEIEPELVDFDKLPVRNQNFQNVYLSDGEKNFACLHFWGGLKKFGFEKVIEKGNFVSCANLQVRMGNSRKNIPQFRVTEFSVFTKVPRNRSLSSALEALRKEFENLDVESFCVDCVRVKNRCNTRNIKENESPYRFNNTDESLSKNKSFVESPCMQNLKSDFNLTGLDFETTFKLDSQLTEAEALRRSRIKSKIEKLKMYGEPPPLTPMHITNKSSKVDKAFVSPVLKSNSARKENVANENEGSPVLKCPRETNVRLYSSHSVASENERSPVLKCPRETNPVRWDSSHSVANENEGSPVLKCPRETNPVRLDSSHSVANENEGSPVLKCPRETNPVRLDSSHSVANENEGSPVLKCPRETNPVRLDSSHSVANENEGSPVLKCPRERNPVRLDSSHSVANEIEGSPVLKCPRERNPVRLYSSQSVVSENEGSPVLKCHREVNPVKLNFSDSVASDDNVAIAEIHKGASENDFSEEFEYSPPLSLDADYL